MARKIISQSKHDREVRRTAAAYEKRGFRVEADVAGYRRPKTIGGYRPDVIAKRGYERVIVEVETPDTVDSLRDCRQQQAFSKAARRSKYTRFRRKVAR